MSNINKIGGDNTTGLIDKNGNTSIKQNLNVSGFETFQSKVASKSLCKRAVGVITGVFGGAGAAVGGIFAIKVGVAAMVRALAGLVGAAAAPFVLIGMGALCIAAIIGGIVLFVKNRKENIYIKELNKLLQSDGVEDKIENKKQAISYLNEMISKHKKGSVEYNATVRFLNENTEIFKLCLGSKDRELFDGIAKFLINVSKNECEKTEYAIKLIIEDCLNLNSTELNTDAVELLTTFLKDNDTKSLACEIVKSKGFSENIQRFLKSKNNGLKTNTISLLSEMLKNNETQATAEEIIKGHIKSDNTRSMDNAIKLLTELSKDKSVQTTVVQIVKNCLVQGDQELRSNAIGLLTNALKSKNTDIETFVKEFFSEKNEFFTEKIGEWLESDNNELKANTIALLTEMLKNKDTQTYAKTIIKNYSGKIGEWLKSGNVQLKANTIALLIEMLRDKNTDLANTAKKIITDEDVAIKSQGFANIMKGCLGSENDGLKAKVVELLNNMLVGSDYKLKKKSREILKSDVLNTKGMLNIFLKNKGNVNEKAISLLKPMCKDNEMKKILSVLIGEDLVRKLEEQGNGIKSADVVNVLYEDVVKGMFSEKNKNHIKNILKEEDGLHNVDISFDENGQITEVKKERQKSFFNGEELNFEGLKKQATLDFGRCLKSITINGNTTKIKRKKRDKNSEILENAFKEGNIDEEAKKLIYKFPGQSTISAGLFLLAKGTDYLDSKCKFLSVFQGSAVSDSYSIVINTDGSVEVQARYVSFIKKVSGTGMIDLPMAIEEVHTFKIEKGQDVYKTTDAKITVYKLESTSIKLTEENLKDQKVLSQVKYDGDENVKK